MDEPLIRRLGYVLYATLVTTLNIIRIMLIWTRLLIIKTFPNMAKKDQCVRNARKVRKEILLGISKASKMGKY